MAAMSKQTMVYIVIGVVAAATLILLMYRSRLATEFPLGKTFLSGSDSNEQPKQPSPRFDSSGTREKGLDSYKTIVKQMDRRTDSEAISQVPLVLPQDTKQAMTELDKLFFERSGNSTNSTNSAAAKACPGYWELRGINFMHPELTHRLCKNQVAYTMLNNKFPPCEISGHLPQQLLKRLNKTAVRTYISSAVTGRNVIIYTYPAGDIVSGYVISSHNWEGGQVSLTLSIAKKFPPGSVTFMDIGCNIGVYCLQAREADIPTVAVDANLRNLIRIRMSANDMGWRSDPKLKLMWTYFHRSVSLQYLNFGTGWCNVGGATSNKDSMTDTIPVMTGQADDLVSSVNTELVVMKIDVETSEYIFFSTGERLFKEKKIVAVQMEFWKSDTSKPAHTSPNFDKIVEFFSRRNYTLYSMGNLNVSLNLRTFNDWDGIWIRNDYLSTVRGKP